MGFIAGCCFGVRSGSAYNDGKELHWREWGMYIPLFNIYVWIWNGIEGANGVTSKELRGEVRRDVLLKSAFGAISNLEDSGRSARNPLFFRVDRTRRGN